MNGLGVSVHRILSFCLVTAFLGLVLLGSSHWHEAKFLESGMHVSAAPGASAAAFSARPVTREAARATAVARYAKLPLMFEENDGQTDPRVKFLSRGAGYTLFLTNMEAVLSLPSDSEESRSAHTRGHSGSSSAQQHEAHRLAHAVKLKFAGASAPSAIAGRDQLLGKTNYFIGSDPRQWHSNVPNYAAVEYRRIYPGVDVVFHGDNQRLEFDFDVAPGADPGKIALEVEGTQRMHVNRAGDVLLSVDGKRDIALGKPHVYQEFDGQRREIAGNFVLDAENRIAFALGPYDHAQPLVIDPTLTYSTYLGGVNTSPSGATVDSTGNLFVTGVTTVSGFPATLGAYQTSAASTDTAFVAELTPAGDALVYATLLGGSSGKDSAAAIAVDASGDAFVTGVAVSTDFPISTNAYQGQCPVISAGTFTCRQQAFLTELNPAGSGLLYSSYFGGTTGSGCFDLSGTNLNYLDAPNIGLYSGNGDYGASIAIDGSGMAYIEGTTCSTDLPTTSGVFQPNNGGVSDVFVAKFNTSQSGSGSLAYSTYLGGSGAEFATGITVDSPGNAYVTGITGSYSTFPTTNGAYQQTGYPPVWLAFITKINSTATSPLAYSTLIGSPAGSITGSNVASLGIAIDSSGAAYITGVATYYFPTTANAYQTACTSVATGGGPECTQDAFVLKLSADGGSLVYSTYFGGDGNDQGLGIAVDGQGDAFITGYTAPSEANLSTYVNHFPTTADALQPSCGLIKNTSACSPDAFLAEFDPNGALLYSSFLGGSLEDFAVGIALDSSGNPFVVGYTNSGDFPTTQGAYKTTIPGSNDVFASKFVFVTTSAPSAEYSNTGPIDFGAVDVNSSGTQQLVLTNAGTSPFTISAISFSGSSTAFSVTNAVCNGVADFPFSSSVSLGGGQSCTFTLQFAPTFFGSGQAELLTILDTATGSNASPAPPGSTGQSFLLLGDGAQPFATFSPSNSSYNLGSVTEGQNATQTITLSNTGAGPLMLNGVSFGLSTSPGFSFSTTCTVPSTINPGGSCTVTVRFAPTNTLGPVSVSLTFADNAGPGQSTLASTTGNPYYQVVSFTGTGVAAPPFALFSPMQLNFGNVVQNTAATKTVAVQNTGTGPLTLDLVYFGVLPPPGFSYTQVVCNGVTEPLPLPSPFTISPTQTCTFTVQFAPTTTGLFSGGLAFADNAASGESNLTSTVINSSTFGQVVSLSGTGVTAPPPSDFTITATPVTVTRGSSGQSTITVTPENGFTDPVCLQLSNSPAGVIASYTANPITGGSGTSTLTLQTATGTPTGTFNLTMTGTDFEGICAGTVKLSHSTSLQLTVNPPGSGGGGGTGGSGGGTANEVVLAAGPVSLDFAAIDFTNPNSPNIVNIRPPFGPGLAVDCGGGGTLAAVGNQNGGQVVIYDLTNPASPAMLGSVTTTLNGIGAIKLSGNWVLVGDISGFQVALIDISTPRSPEILSTFQTQTAGITSVALSGSYAVVSGPLSTKIDIIDYSDPANPSDSLFDPNVAQGLPGLAVDLDGTYAAVGSQYNSNIALVDVTGPTILGTVSSGLTGVDGVQNLSISIKGSQVAVGSSNYFSVALIDFTNFSSPAVSDFNPNSGGGWTVNRTSQRLAIGNITGFNVALYSLSGTSATPLGNVPASGVASTSTICIADFNSVTPNTATGSNVKVQPVDASSGTSPVTVTFTGGVSQGGQTSLSITGSGPTPPADFQIGNPPTYYNLSTTAAYSAPVKVCINYTGSSTPPPVLMHYDTTLTPPSWVNLTTTSSGGLVCGLVYSYPLFSPFAIGQSNPYIALTPGVISTVQSSTATGSILSAVAFDTQGNAYLLDSGLGTVTEYPSDGGSTR